MNQDAVRLGHIRLAISRILDYVAAGEAEFLANTIIQDAVIKNFENIGEAVKNLSVELRDRHPQIYWQRISRMRDVLAHAYFRTDLAILWTAIKIDLPDLLAVVEQELADLA